MYTYPVTGTVVNVSAEARKKNHSRREKNRQAQAKKDDAKATIIQKVVRRYRVRARVMWVRQLKRQNEREEKERQIMHLSLSVQRIYRGHLGRVIASNIARTQNQITISKIIRGFLARRLVFEKKKYLAAAITIERYYRGHVAYRSYQEFQATNRMRQKPALQVQSRFRCIKAKLELQRRRLQERRAAEMRIYAIERLGYCRKRGRFKLVLDSAFGERSYIGEIQIFLRSIPVLVTLRSHSKMKKSHKGRFYQIFQGYSRNNWEKMSANDVELMFTKVCSHGEKHIDYLQFISSLDLVASTMFSDTMRYETAGKGHAKLTKHIFQPQ